MEKPCGAGAAGPGGPGLPVTGRGRGTALGLEAILGAPPGTWKSPSWGRADGNRFGIFIYLYSAMFQKGFKKA